jgi:hypothetical protein
MRRKKSLKKVKAPSVKEKSTNLRFFLPSPPVEIQFQSARPLGRGKARVLRGKETGGRDRGEETEG